MNASSGSVNFDRLREAFVNNDQLGKEVADLLRLSVERYNPSDPGLRFISGGITEWTLVLAAYAAGVVTLPQGHGQHKTDLHEVVGQSREMWSIKGSNTRGGTFRISNGQGGAGAGFVVPTIFLSPEFPGIIFADPFVHFSLAEQVVSKGDSTHLSKRAVREHGEREPACVIEVDIPTNPKNEVIDVALDFIKVLIEGRNFPLLGRLLNDAKPAKLDLVSQIQELVGLHEQGVLSDEQLDAALDKVVGQ